MRRLPTLSRRYALRQAPFPPSGARPLPPFFLRQTSPRSPLLLQGEEPRLGIFVHRIVASRLLDPGESGSSCLIVCGDNVFRPDIIVQRSKEAAMDPHTLLSRIRISRAVTIHQFHTLVVSRIEEESKRFQASLILLSGILPLFSDGAVSERESSGLLRSVMTTLRGIALRRSVPCILPVDRCEAMKDARSRRLFSLLESLSESGMLQKLPRDEKSAPHRIPGKLFADQEP